MNGLKESKLSANFPFWVNYSFKLNPKIIINGAVKNRNQNQKQNR